MDARKIEELSGFATFLEFLKNPEPVAAQIKELNASVKEWRAANEKARGIKDVDDWKLGVQKEMNERSAALDAREAEISKQDEAERAALAKSVDAHNKAKAKLADDRKVVDQKLAEVDAMLAQKAEQAKTEKRLNEKEERLSVQEKDLKDRLAKLSQLMAGK